MLALEIRQMLEIISLDGLQNIQFESYNELFDYIVKIGNLKLLKRRLDQKQDDWNFTTYSPKQVFALFTHANEQSSAIREAYDEGLPLIEICAGSSKHPIYVVNTPNTDIDYLMSKWCLDFCTFHDFILRDYSKVHKSNLHTTKKSLILPDLVTVGFQ